MGSLLDIQVFTSDTRHAHQAIQKAFEEFHRLDGLLSVFKPTSLVTQINRGAGKCAVELPDEVLALVQHAMIYEKATDGNFTILVEPLMRLWGFRGHESARYPTDRELHLAVEAACPGSLFIEAKNNMVGLLNPHSAIDFGGIAVGYALDRAVAVLRSEGIECGLINHAGDIIAMGAPPDSEGWDVAITDPSNRADAAYQFTLKDAAIATSGNYESYRDVGETRIGHILTPHRGSNPNHYLSLSIITSNAMDADALSTGLFCSGSIPLHTKHIAITANPGSPPTVSVRV